MRAARALRREKERRYEAEMNNLRKTIQESLNKDDEMEALRQEVRSAKEKAAGHQLLKAKPIHDFDGQQENWTKWKSDAIATFAVTGHEEIMNDPDAARNAPSKNKAVWGTLLSECSGGSAHSKIIKHEDTFDGHAAWQELLGWYDSDNRRESYAETLKLRLQYNQLHPNGKISDYINTFELTYHKLRKIPPYHMTEWDAKSIFARNIRDPNLERFKEELLENKTDRTLEEMIVKLQIHDKELARTAFDSRGGPKRVRRNPDGPNKRQRTGSSGTGTLAGTIHPNLKGILRIPPDTWHELSQQYRDWVLKYNQAVRHSDTPPPTPEGVTVDPPQDDGLNHFIPKSSRQQHVRRVMAQPAMNAHGPLSLPTTEPLPVVLNILADDSDQSIGTIDETELFPPGSTTLKTVRFHLHSGGDTGDGKDDGKDKTQNAANSNSTPRRNASSENEDEDCEGEDLPDIAARMEPDSDNEKESNNNDTKKE
eukprot:jgi/Psemu1/39319/gm1.39319_g